METCSCYQYLAIVEKSWVELSMSTDWKFTSYNPILVDEDGTQQVSANNDRCTRACKSLYSPYSQTQPTTAPSTQLYFKAQLSTQSSSLFCAAT